MDDALRSLFYQFTSFHQGSYLLAEKESDVDAIQKAITWLSGRFHSNNGDAWVWPTAILLSAVALLPLLQLLKGVLDVLIKLAKAWISFGALGRNRLKAKEKVLQCQNFCNALRFDIENLDRGESWIDRAFTDLEAEVEAEGGYYSYALWGLIKRRSSGLRRVQSLVKAIETSTERCLLLVGEPGSGKSVALRHLARKMAQREATSRAAPKCIPLYVNLKEFKPEEYATESNEAVHQISGENLTAAAVKEFVINYVRHNDPDITDYIRQNWADYRTNGTWYFLLDSFDEIPAVMHAPSGSPIIQQYSEAIRQFLEGMSSCRGIVASREYKGPAALPWWKFRILALSETRQEQLVENTFLTSEQKAIVRRHLATEVTALRHSPLFLTLLTNFVKNKNEAPLNDHDLLQKHIAALCARDPAYVKRKYGMESHEIIEFAKQIAALFARSARLSLAPTEDDIASALPTDSPLREKLSEILACLVDIKIGRRDVREARPGDRRYTFAHRRYQETLFVMYLAQDPTAVAVRELLTDSRWREYTATLLQTQPSELVAHFVDEAVGLLREYQAAMPSADICSSLGQGIMYYRWDSDPVDHVARLLQVGLARRSPSELPQLAASLDSLSAALDSLLSARWSNADPYDQYRSLQIAGLLPNQRLEEWLSDSGLRRLSAFDDTAFRMTVFLRAIREEMARWICRTLAAKVLTARKRSELLRIEALAARLPPSAGAEVVTRRCEELRWFAFWLLIPVVRISRLQNRRSNRVQSNFAVADASSQ
jgi:predicted ATPase